jgi:putative acetyltransferase
MKKFEINSYSSDNQQFIVEKLFREYEKYLGIDLCFQDFEAELANLPGKYAEPEGTILLASVNDDYVGVVALRKIEDGICEMKRLYVQESARGLGIARTFSEKLIEVARTKGYHTMKLDTLARLEAATNLYRSLGFQEVKPYNFNPEEDVLYFEMKL